jgi:Papain fold toxin 1, glutamine deamidase
MPRLDGPRAELPEPEAAAPTARIPAPDRGLGRPGVLERADRVERAAAHRTAVEAAYGNETGQARTERTERPQAPADSGRVADVAANYPADYARPVHPPPRVDGPHQSPRSWLRAVNADEAQPGRDNNCGECTRAVHDTWHGRPVAAAALADRDSAGEPAGRMAEWAGRRPVRATMAEIGQRLEQLGPGGSAVVGCDWKGGVGGHWFNAVNDAGRVLAVDGQRNRVGPWPPTVRDLRFDESRMQWSDAIFYGPDGKVVRS